MDDPLPSVAWWLALAGTAAAYVFVAQAKVAFRLLGPVSVAALADRLGEERAEFLRKSLHGPTAFWFTLHLASSFLLACAVLVLFAGTASVGAGESRFALWPTGGLGHDALLGFGLLVAIFVAEGLLPAIVARRDPAAVVAASLPALRALHAVLGPVSSALAAGVGGAPAEDDGEASPEGVAAFIDVGEREGILEKDEGAILRNLVVFGDTRAHEVMTPRTDLVAVGEDTTVADAVAAMARSRFSRLPVHGSSLDEVHGVVTLKDAVAALQAGRGGERVTSLQRKAVTVPESKRIAELLPEMQASRQQVAIVIDEYGGTAGLVTIEDLLEELVGEIREEHEVVGEDVVAAGEKAWLVRGRTSLHDAGEAIGVDLEDSEASTVGGLLLALLHRVPRAGDAVEHAGLRFAVEDADRRRVKLVRVTPCAPGRGEPGESAPGPHAAEADLP